MATVSSSMTQYSIAPPASGRVSTLQASGGTTFIIDMIAGRSGNSRGRNLTLTVVGTAFSTVTSIQTSMDGTNVETMVKLDETSATVPATSGTTMYCLGHDSRFLHIITTGGDTTSGWLATISG